ncbi:MAG: helix-turn-helix transcriptional regulator [Brumimicrobium sp.]|nr:helix-turn-helix transcriptional regulator [Brumimicrobium sp.]
MVDEIGSRIRMFREQKGLSQENLAMELGITQPSYARLEKDDSRINVPRLIQIAKLLDVTVAEVLNEKANTVINQQNSQYPSTYYASVQTINSDKEHIQSLQNEVAFLKKTVEKLLG